MSAIPSAALALTFAEWINNGLLLCPVTPKLPLEQCHLHAGAEAHGTADLRPETMDLSVHAPSLDVQSRLYMQPPDLEAMKKATTQAEVTALASQVSAGWVSAMLQQEVAMPLCMMVQVSHV